MGADAAVARKPRRAGVKIDVGDDDELAPILAQTLREWQFAKEPIDEALQASSRLMDVAFSAMGKGRDNRDMVHVEVRRFRARVFLCVSGDGMEPVQAPELEKIPKPRGTYVHHDDRFHVDRRAVWCVVTLGEASSKFGGVR